jgi:hypothetical protein
MPPSPATRVFAVTELAEAIFLELPVRQILVNVQRVCRQWKAVVDGSTPLQQALFFKPTTTEPLSLVENRQFPYWESKNFKTADPGGTERKRHLAELPVITQIVHDHQELLKITALSYPNASWRRMLLTQPPINTCNVSIWQFSGGEKTLIISKKESRSGLLAGEVLSDLAWADNDWKRTHIRGWAC